MALVDLDRDACYRALRTRDPRFDGRFYTGVVSTGIYCRPICPAPTPKFENCVFLPSAAAAHQLGFRPCLRCRPEVAPGLAGWHGPARTVSRALHLIAEGGLGDGGVEDLAERLGIGDRQLRRLFDRYVGASPIVVAQAHRILFANLLATIHTSDVSGLATIVARLRRLFDLDVDIAAVEAHLATDRRLASRVRERPGVRVPGAWDSFELAVRALLGQQITVAGARTMAGRLVAAHGEAFRADESAGNGRPDRLFPAPATLAHADLTSIGLTRPRAAALRGLGAAMAADPDLLRPCETLDETLEKLAVLPGVGPWTAQYIAMRALREPDAFPASDLGLLRAMATPAGRPAPAALERRAEAWRPWRAYAAMRLWIQG